MVSAECYCSGYHSPPIPYDQGAHYRYHLLVLSPKYSVRCSPSDIYLPTIIEFGSSGRGSQGAGSCVPTQGRLCSISVKSPGWGDFLAG